ncbi:hypothetical protein [Rossellomorea marisflavi]|uniref:hypothetical protein n=1 Tax=Rossellomorea marisflavi TaxID=189381 RepID=UPI003459EC6C
MEQAKSPCYVIHEGGWIRRVVTAVALGLGSWLLCRDGKGTDQGKREPAGIHELKTKQVTLDVYCS